MERVAGHTQSCAARGSPAERWRRGRLRARLHHVRVITPWTQTGDALEVGQVGIRRGGSLWPHAAQDASMLARTETHGCFVFHTASAMGLATLLAQAWLSWRSRPHVPQCSRSIETVASRRRPCLNLRCLGPALSRSGSSAVFWPEQSVVLAACEAGAGAGHRVGDDERRAQPGANACAWDQVGRSGDGRACSACSCKQPVVDVVGACG